MKLSQNGIKMIAHHEGVRKKPYKCPAGLWTVGVGHLIGDGKTLPPEWNKIFSLEEVYAILAKDVTRFERGVGRLITVPLTQGMFDCLVSFAFNIGLGGLQRSPVRQKINRKEFDEAAESLLGYNKAKDPKTGMKRVLPGLDKRRKDEVRTYYMGRPVPDYLRERL